MLFILAIILLDMSASAILNLIPKYLKGLFLSRSFEGDYYQFQVPVLIEAFNEKSVEEFK